MAARAEEVTCLKDSMYFVGNLQKLVNNMAG